MKYPFPFDALHNILPIAVRMIAVGEPWDPSADGAMQNLCLETLKIFNHESGNVLVFLPKVSSVLECSDLMKKLVRHDPTIKVRPLFASLEDWEREKIVNFCDEEENKCESCKGKRCHKCNHTGMKNRLICFSTNVAEAGVTIPGLSAVVETGREIDVCYDYDLKTSVFKMDWISKASWDQVRDQCSVKSLTLTN